MLFRSGKEVSLKKGIHIQTVNISASGLLLQADVGCFDIGEVFSLVLRVQEGVLEMQCEVVRIQEVNAPLKEGEDLALREEYGCRIRETRFEPEKRRG